MSAQVHNLRTGIRGIALSLALMLPVSTSAPALADDAAGSFDTNFAAIGSPLTRAAATDGSVDMATITPRSEFAVGASEGEDFDTIGSGVASYYADKFNGRRTASGDTFSNSALTAAHRTLPFGSKVRVTNPDNGRSVVVRVNDRGPFHGSRVMDLSRAAAEKLGLVARGSGRVTLAVAN